ncbi:hypothetical protein FB45DRAFT_1057745 [Roridomyces roridus]|uniref:Uncharacterized protein n=1 Tax=Roridomyces roridus TaxID=1738132 RepID=A0AAD7BX25_9AGAR|nr:hypothetical protein FB45DRAFT_1057745 [Roridomyces roridus]
MDLVLSSLHVPADFNRYDSIPEVEVIARLDRWKDAVVGTLQELDTRLQQEHANLSLKERADIVFAVSVFDGDDAWVSPHSRRLATHILSRFEEQPLPLIVQMLQHNIKPVFRANPHPSINLETGRKLVRPAGGPMASQDFYDNQLWKDRPGVANAVLWCVRHLPSDAYDELWHLVIPPIMALLDDYEARYKLMGVRIASVMLENITSSILKRTGIDSLLLASFNRAFTVLDRPETPLILPAAISASLALIISTTQVGSAARFDQLCGLLGDGIIGSIWPYASDRLPALLASIEALPPVVEALGVGCARYLKVLVAQLTHPLVPLEYGNAPPATLQIASLRALCAVMHACPERMSHWKGTILNGVARCWVGSSDKEVKLELKNVCRGLAVACPSVLQEEYPRFIATDAEMFRDLCTSQ